MKKKTKIVQKNRPQSVPVEPLPLFFQDKMETLEGVSKLSPKFQRAIYRDAVRVVEFCKNPVRLWKFQQLTPKQQKKYLPNLYQGYSTRSRDRMFEEAQIYIRYLIRRRPENAVRSFWNRLMRRR